MTIHLPDELQRYLQNEVGNGRFVSQEEAIAEAVRLLQQQRQTSEVQGQPLTEAELERRLTQSGFLAIVPPLPVATTSARAFRPIAIEGEPLSETVIRERR
jgi:Arc/MetJ-type ribon-helix-helix transcriptional regulator